ncbi:hypothetical protein SmJEL517_g01271 [Synchytrium microbalum]|uniref:Tctex1 domain-containing protein 2 n=1 Tax=Synchytrium microbalum TaxID=1806994 RepID=A0A507C4U6_9FUNG|nr:uncharacterized protein SmJEL517_g01271 [Synchytrium microbalum]TPX36570.1 hypothetical protein SmJEL517_g01271 [Synchytrium microbalum]
MSSGGLAMSQDEAHTIRPNFKSKFRSGPVQKIIHDVLQSRLAGATYDQTQCSTWTREISDEIKNRLKELDLQRYKFAVNVILGEQRGEGVRIGARCLWDADTDNIAQDVFMNESIFCIACAFGVFYY